MTKVTMEVPQEALSSIRCAPEEFSREMRLAAAALWYEQGKVSQEVAAQIAGLHRVDFLLALARMGKDSFHVDFESLDRELAQD